MSSALTYDTVNSGGAREGALDAIKEYNQVTNGSVQVETFLVESSESSGGHYNICQNILRENPDVLFDVSLRRPEVARIGSRVGLVTITASLGVDPSEDGECSKELSKVENGLVRTFTNEPTSTYKRLKGEEKESRSLIRFKSPTHLLLEAIRDVTNKYELNKKFLRILYDKDYGKSFPHL